MKNKNKTNERDVVFRATRDECARMMKHNR